VTSGLKRYASSTSGTWSSRSLNAGTVRLDSMPNSSPTGTILSGLSITISVTSPSFAARHCGGTAHASGVAIRDALRAIIPVLFFRYKLFRFIGLA
jgi:hypothetical protein